MTDADLMRTAAVLLARYGTCLLTLADSKGALYDRALPSTEADGGAGEEPGVKPSDPALRQCRE